MQILLDDIARTLGATSVTLPDSPIEMQVVEAEANRRMVPEQPPLDLAKLSLDLEEPSNNMVSNVRGLKDVSSSYRGVGSLMPQTRALERQLA
jgi:hypothetical protein